MGFGKACLSALVVSVVVAWPTNTTAEVTRGVILRVTVHANPGWCRPRPEAIAASGSRLRIVRACVSRLEPDRNRSTRQLCGRSHSSMPARPAVRLKC